MSEPSTSASAAAEPINEWCERLKRRGSQGLMDEFNTIKAEKLAGTTTAFEQNTQLNRYGNITLLDETRVVLNDDLPPKYIHASYVDGYNRPKAYIICQAPVPGTIVDYWRMVWQERIGLIVCLTSLKERGATKAEVFFPPELCRPFRAGPFRIIAEAIVPLRGFHRIQLIHLRLKCWFAKKIKEGEDRSVVMVYYGVWPDTAVPQDTPLFLKFVRQIKHLEKFADDGAPTGSNKPPYLFHCSAGVGRSATLVACRIALDQLEATQRVDIAGLVRKMRRQRAMAVQNVLQYMFINLLVLEAARQRRSQLQ